MKDLTIVIASVDAVRSIERCVSAFERTCQGVDAELLVVDASRDATAEIMVARFPHVRLLRREYGTLTPTLWAEGYNASSGRVVALTTGHCVPSAGWARAMIDHLAHGAAGVGGPLDLAEGTGPLDWAVFYLRYSAFMPKTIGDGRVTGEIAGDNAAYRRDALDRHAATFEDGLWETDFHRLVRADGGWLEATSGALVEFGPSFPAGTIVRHRFAHGRRFGAGRARFGTRASWQIAIAAPLVPFVLAVRTASRVLPVAAHRRRFLAALPWFFVVASAWAAGEAWGALEGVRG